MPMAVDGTASKHESGNEAHHVEPRRMIGEPGDENGRNSPKRGQEIHEQDTRHRDGALEHRVRSHRRKHALAETRDESAAESEPAHEGREHEARRQDGAAEREGGLVEPERLEHERRRSRHEEQRDQRRRRRRPLVGPRAIRAWVSVRARVRRHGHGTIGLYHA